MHCSTSGAPGSLLPDSVLSSPLSHRSEYHPQRALLSLRSDGVGEGAGCVQAHVCVCDFQAWRCLCMYTSQLLRQEEFNFVMGKD